jgi:hypothetical protein
MPATRPIPIVVKARQLGEVGMVSNERRYGFFPPSRGQFMEVIESQRLVKRIVKWTELIRKLNNYILLRELSRVFVQYQTL